MSRRRWIFVALSLAAVSVGFGSWSYHETAQSRNFTASFVGRQSCAACHAEQVKRYTGSHHDLAMDVATAETVVDLGAFDDQEFTHFGLTSKFFRRDGKFFVTTEGETGAIETFEIKYVFGVDPIQQYLVEFPDRKTVIAPNGENVELAAGRIQCLSIAWDVHRGRWFHLYAKEKIPAGDWLHWTGGGQNWNYMCADCHSTNLQKNYDAANNAYHTKWSEIDVSCEACHGPASEHLARAESSLGFSDPRHFHSYGLNRLKGGSSLAEIETCAPCHSRRRIVHGEYIHGKPYSDFYEVTDLARAEYFADGQINEELYEYGSFLQSRMFRENVRCSNCHDPHSLRPKFAGNALCTQCHIPARYDTPAHHHHLAESSGSQCVECHMPRRTYMEIDPRRDHSIRVPRPDLTAKLGVPNACQQCHSENSETAAGTSDDPVQIAERRQTASSMSPGIYAYQVPISDRNGAKPRTTEQLVADVQAWFPDSKYRKRPHFGEILEAGRRGEPDAGPALCELARRRPLDTSEQRAVAVGPIVRASALALLSPYPGEQIRETVLRALDDVDPLIRTAAVGQVPALGSFQNDKGLLIAKLRDPVRSVRTEAAATLAIIPKEQFSPEERALFQNVFQEWEQGMQATIDSAGANRAMGLAYQRMIQSVDPRNAAAWAEAVRTWGAKAEAAFRRAVSIDPQLTDAVFSLARFLDDLGRQSEAERLYRRAMTDAAARRDLAPDYFFAEVHYRLGRLLLRDPSGDRVNDAAVELKKSLDYDPNRPDTVQYYGVALLGLNHFTEAEEALKRWCSMTPEGPPMLFTYATRAFQSRQPDQARLFLKVLLDVDPRAATRYPDLQELQRRLGER